MAVVTGVVERTNENFGKFNMMVDGKWYNTKPEFLKVQPTAGQQVEFDDGGKNYIKSLKISGAGSTTAAKPSSSGSSPVASTGGRTFPVHPLAPERTINRQNALTNAVAYLRDSEVSPEQVIDVARIFEAYTTGDLDAQEAEAAVKAMGI